MSAAEQKVLAVLPEIPRKRYFAIGEVSYLCDVKPHVLRYWEQEFPQLKPVKRRGNRRYYQQDDVQMVRQIRTLLYEQGFTIGGARLRLREQPKSGSPVTPAVSAPPKPKRSGEIKKLRNDLESLLKLIPE